MSRAGTKSDQGDDYQRLVALHWIIRLVQEDEIDYIQAQSNGLPDIKEEIRVDDVVVVYTEGHRRHISVKKSQPRNKAWSFTDQALIDELPKIRDQLESYERTIVELYSSTPFGDLQSLVDAGSEYPDLAAFKRSGGKDLQKTLSKLASMWERSELDSFKLLHRLEVASSLSFDGWERQNKLDLERLISNADLGMMALESFITAHQSKLKAKTLIIKRDHVLEYLAQNGLVKVPKYSEAEIIKEFQKISRIGREWQRTVGGRKIERAELNEIIHLIEDGADTVLITERPGSGKTCLLLDLADCIEKNNRYGLVFLRGDFFTRLNKVADLEEAGLPEDIIGLCGKLSASRRVIVIIDSLDVLSINREHDSLKVFLQIIDSLQPMRNITVVAACRSFDLQYDPLLRDREWKHRIQLADLDYENDVTPLLKDWGVQEDALHPMLKDLLLLPKNLVLFESIAKRSGRCDIRTVYDLHEAYLDDVVMKDPDLGNTAMLALQAMADRLLRDRAQRLPVACFSADEPVRRRLVSNGILSQDLNGGLGFGHQTIFDNLVVYSSLARGEDLACFIKAYPPFPFIRPIVRTYLFHLRSHAPALFSKQVWAALIDPDIAYHLKRLIAESLAEIIPQDQDWPLIMRLFRQSPDLFQRLCWHFKGESWFRFLVDQWFPSLGQSDTSKEWHSLFLRLLESWMDSHPEEVVGLYRRALSEQWEDKSSLAFQITLKLHKFKHWEVAGIEELINTLLEENKRERDLLGQVVSRYVSVTNLGDSLLWSYIIKDIDPEDFSRLSYNKKLHCSPHDFHQENFLRDRLCCSAQLLSNAINTLLLWTNESQRDSSLHRLQNRYLHSSSWRNSHEKDDTRHVDSLNVLLDGIEHALANHAKANDSWWREYEPQLRQTCEVTLLYFLIQGYKQNPDANIIGITALLTDRELLRFGHLEYELGELIAISYHLIDTNLQETIQQYILELYSDEGVIMENMPTWVSHQIYQYLGRIPVILRQPSAQSFVERFQQQIGKTLPTPRIYSRGGWVKHPVPIDVFVKISNAGLLHMLTYYNDYKEDSWHPADEGLGGRGMVKSVLSEAAALDPIRYLSLLHMFHNQGLMPDYQNCVLEGCANHLRYRFGNLQPPQGWQYVKPEPDGPTIALALLDIIERCREVWEDGYSVAHIVEACCDVLIDIESAERLVFLLFRLLKHPIPEDEQQTTSPKNLLSESISSVRGIAAGSAITLCNNLLDQEKELPELMFPLLRHYARDNAVSVRAALLGHVPFLTYKKRDWGWQLFSDIFRESQDYLWPLAERHLYHQYHDHFGKVLPYLTRMMVEAPNEAGGAYGRIATLASLSGHITQEDLFANLEKIQVNEAWRGAAHVFSSNLDQQYDLCKRGLKYILERDNLDASALSIIENAFDPNNNGRLLDADFAIFFVESMELQEGEIRLDDFLIWITDIARREPVSALGVCEKLVQKLNNLKPKYPLWNSKPLISALSSILREADETDDSQLIQRAIRLQDEFLKMDLNGMSDYFDNAARP